jgi:hypothetical protein
LDVTAKDINIAFHGNKDPPGRGAGRSEKLRRFEIIERRTVSSSGRQDVVDCSPSRMVRTCRS